jgi:hypothetical protein
MNENEKACPDCAETIKKSALVCKHCGYRFSGPAGEGAANSDGDTLKVKFLRQASWYGILVKLSLYADQAKLGTIGAGQELEVTLNPTVQSVHGQLQGIPMEPLPVEQLKDGDTVFIRSKATAFNFVSLSKIPLEFEILPTGTLVDAGSKSDKIRKLLKVSTAAVFLLIATMALVKEGWRFSGYDTKEQMEAAEAGGFSDKDAFLAAQTAGINTFGEWEQFSVEMSEAGFDDVSKFIAFREKETAKKEAAERLAREEDRRNELIEKALFYWSCSMAFGVMNSIDLALNRASESNVEAMKISLQVAVGHLVLAGKTKEDAPKFWDENFNRVPIVAQFKEATDKREVLRTAQLAVQHSAKCAEKFQERDADLVYVMQNPISQ